MAEAGLFCGWGEPITGREAKGLEVFAEALAYYGKAEQPGGSSPTTLTPSPSGPAESIITARSEQKTICPERPRRVPMRPF